jgi:ADP-ribose pyrophosphatase YjhB (NUDIX family)/GNAT superfamily N-acetyltransferase
MEIIELTDEYRPWARDLLTENWASSRVVTRGKIHQADELPGLVAVMDKQPVGLLTYAIENGECEVVSLNSLVEGRGIGSALVRGAVSIARSHGCSRLWLITTNDNTHALRFYQRLGMVIAAMYPNVLVESRKLKPEIPEIGMDGIPLRDEIELEMRLAGDEARPVVKRFGQIATSHLLLVQDGCVLLSRRANTGFRDGEYSVPAGHIEPDETARECMVREAREELGLAIHLDDLQVAHVMHRHENEHRIDFFWLARRWQGEPEIVEPDKCDGIGWFPLDDLPGNIVPYVRKAIEEYLSGHVYSEMYWTR